MQFSDVDMTPSRSYSRSRRTAQSSSLPPPSSAFRESPGIGRDANTRNNEFEFRNEHEHENESQNESSAPSLGCCHNTLELSTNILHMIHFTVGISLLSYAIALSFHKPDPQHGAAIILELYATLLLVTCSTGFLGSRPQRAWCKRIPLRISIQLAPILAGIYSLMILIVLVEHASIWNYILEKKTELYLSNGMIAFLQSHVHVGFVASCLGIAAVVELLRYCLLQRLKDRLVAIDEERRREYLDGRAREASDWEATSSSGQLQSQSQSRSRRRRNWNDWTRRENANGNGNEENDDGMETPLLSESQPENWAMEDNTSVQSQSASASASATNQSAVSWWEEPDANTNTNTDNTDMNTSSTSKKSWFSRAFDKTSASDAGGGSGSGSGSGSAAPGDTSSVDFAPIDGDLDMEMGHQSWAVEDSSATVGADEAGGFGFGSSSGGGGGGNRDEPDLSWAVEKDD